MDTFVHDPLVLYNRTKFTEEEYLEYENKSLEKHEIFRFEQSNNWHFRELKSITDSLEIKLVQVSIPLAEIYEGIKFD